MVTSKRIALLTGASIATLGLAMPAYAVTAPGITQTTLGNNAIATLTIGSIGDDFDFGVTNVGGTPVTSTVNTVPTGEIHQLGTATGIAVASGYVDLLLTNAGDITVEAIATNMVSK